MKNDKTLFTKRREAFKRLYVAERNDNIYVVAKYGKQLRTTEFFDDTLKAFILFLRIFTDDKVRRASIINVVYPILFDFFRGLELLVDIPLSVLLCIAIQ